MFSFFDIDKNNASHKLVGCVATIGNFDGVHLAHKKLLSKCDEEAKKRNLPSVAITFDPHPSKLFSKNPILPLIDLEQKLKRIEELGIDYTFVIPFTQNFAKQSSKEFIQEILIDILHCKKLIVGYNFCMGSDKLACSELEKDLSQHDCLLEIQEKVTYIDENNEEHTISSTSIRQALENGEIKKVNEMLGHKHIVYGIVEHGAKRGGAQLGFPTANLDTGNMLLPQKGVYATQISFPNKKDEKVYKSISNIGYNPTFNGKKLLIETFILDFNEQIYNEKLQVAFLTRIRDEKKFNSINELVAQLNKDKIFRENLCMQNLYKKL